MDDSVPPSPDVESQSRQPDLEPDKTRSHDSPPDEERDAEPWTRSNEDLLRSWCSNWSKANRDHAAQHETFSLWQNRVALPSVALPLVFSPLSNTFRQSNCDSAGQQTKDVLVMVGFVLCSITSALNAYFKWGVTGEKHLAASRQYADLVSDTEEILAKLRRHRPHAAVTLRTLKDRSDHLMQWAPPLPLAMQSTRGEACSFCPPEG